MKKIIIVILIAALILHFSKARANNVTPPPQNSCVVTYNPDNKAQITCQFAGNSLIFVLGTATVWKNGGTYYQLWQMLGSVSDSRTFYNLKYFVFTYGNSPEEVTNLSKLKIVGLGWQYPSCTGNYFSMNGGIKLVDSSRTSIEQCYTFSGTGYGLGLFDQSLPETGFQTIQQTYSPTVKDQSIVASLRALYDRIKSSGGVGVDAAGLNVAPSSTIQSQCGPAIKPILQESTGFAAALEKEKTDFLAQISASSASDQRKQELTALITNKLSGDNWKSAYPADTDNRLYNQFYSTNGSYPDIPTDQNTYTRFQELVMAQAEGEAGLGYMGTLSRNLIEIIDFSKAGQMLDKAIPMMAAYYYINKNIEYRKCASAKDPNDPYAKMFASQLDSFQQNIEALRVSSTNTLNGLAAGQTECDKIAGSGYIANMIGQAFCGLIINLKDWADTFYCWSLGLFESAVGVSTSGSKSANIDDSTICGSNTTSGVNELNNAGTQ